MKKIDEVGGGTIAFIVSIVPRSSKDEIIGWTSQGELKVRVTAPPVDQAANKELVRLLAKSLDSPRSGIHIKSGLLSRRKKIEAPATSKNRLLSFSDI